MKWINKQADFDSLVTALKNESVLALDTEADSLHSYFDKVCLIQVSTPHADFLIDPLARLDLSGLGPVLGDRAVTKIFHGADYDLRILNRDFGFTIANLVDTMICAQLAGYEAVGLAALLRKHFAIELDKSHQRANWAMRPLPRDMLQYAATDTHHLVELGDALRLQRGDRRQHMFRRDDRPIDLQLRRNAVSRFLQPIDSRLETAIAIPRFSLHACRQLLVRNGKGLFDEREELRSVFAEVVAGHARDFRERLVRSRNRSSDLE